MRRTLALLAVAALALGAVGDGVPEPDATITLSEHVVAMTDHLAPGRNVLELRNAGHAHHDLTICVYEPANGKCASPAIPQHVLVRPADARGQEFYRDVMDSVVIGKRWTAVVAVDLPPGTYRFYCAIVNHAAQGMSTVVTVG